MKQKTQNLECARFQAQLAELVGSGQNLSLHPHLATCPRCRALLRDLETIAEAARQLMASIDPPEDLWQNIESAIRQEEASPAPKEALPAPAEKSEQ
jgi:anti-sigma factor RsiW